MENKGLSITLPAIKDSDVPQRLSLEKTGEAEKRLVEAKMVNPATYSELEFTFNESYRELKVHLATVGFNIAMAEKHLANIKAEIILDHYPEFLKDKPSKFDNAEVRNAYVQKNPEYQKTLDTVNTLKAIETLMDGKVKVMERVTSYMKKQMDLILKSGVNPNLYVSGLGKK